MGQDEAFWLLRAEGATIFELRTGDKSALHHAIKLRRQAVVERLLEDVTKPADANAKDANRTSLFWMAYQAGDLGASTETVYAAFYNAPIQGAGDLSVDTKGYNPLDASAWVVQPNALPCQPRLGGSACHYKGPAAAVAEAPGRLLVYLLLDAGADMTSTVRRAAGKHRMVALDALMAHARVADF